jgi:uncharacterized protein
MYTALILAGIAIFAFVLQTVFSGFTDIFVLVSADALTRPWILITSIFLHGDIVHLLYNMFALALFGMILEKVVGMKKFLWIFFVGGLLAGIGSTFLYNAALGASGAVFGILGTLAVLRPRMQVWVSFIPMPMIVAAGVWALGDFFGLFIPNGIANLAHLIGLAFGIGVGFYLKKEFGAVSRQGYGGVELDEDMMERWEDKYMRR